MVEANADERHGIWRTARLVRSELLLDKGKVYSRNPVTHEQLSQEELHATVSLFGLGNKDGAHNEMHGVQT